VGRRVWRGSLSAWRIRALPGETGWSKSGHSAVKHLAGSLAASSLAIGLVASRPRRRPSLSGDPRSRLHYSLCMFNPVCSRVGEMAVTRQVSIFSGLILSPYNACFLSSDRIAYEESKAGMSPS
jgi:hypothetical protein